MRERSEATPASVASLLLAFYREPATHRPAFLHDPDGVAGGAHVFRFAAGKFPPALLRTLSLDERLNLRQAACAFIRQVCFWEGANHYQVLTLRHEASIEDVKDHYRLLMALVHPDRGERDLETEQPWPTGCVQRANAAYEVLGDSTRRAAYDARMQRPHPGAAPVPPARPNAPRPRIPMRRKAITAAIVVCAVLALGAAQVLWLEGHEAPDWLPRAMPADAASDATHEPRFLSLARASSLLMDIVQAPVLPSLAAPVAIDPVPPVKPASVRAIPPQPEATAVTVAAANYPPPAAPLAAPRRNRQAEPAPAPLVLAQAPARSHEESATKPADISNKDVELLLAKVVSYYEAGDADRLMGLVDGPGFWSAMQTRNAYESFFRATKQRRLRIDNLSWRMVDGNAYARGRGEVIADYLDNTAPRLDRKIDVEVDIARRDGGVRISRLSLFPSGP